MKKVLLSVALLSSTMAGAAMAESPWGLDGRNITVLIEQSAQTETEASSTSDEDKNVKVQKDTDEK